MNINITNQLFHSLFRIFEIRVRGSNYIKVRINWIKKMINNFISKMKTARSDWFPPPLSAVFMSVSRVKKFI